MRELTLTQSYSIISLNALDSLHMTTIKKISLRCVCAAAILELYLDNCFTKKEDKLVLHKEILNQSKISLYQVEVLTCLFKEKNCIEGTLEWWLTQAAALSARKLKKVEHAITDSLRGLELLEEVPNLLGCDLEFRTAGISMKEYRSNHGEYTKQTESIRAEVLEEGVMSDEYVYMLWLLRESYCMQGIFSNTELDIVFTRINELYKNSILAKTLFPINIHRSIETSIKQLLESKKKLIKGRFWTGLNYTFPIIERSQSIFIETEAMCANAEQRLHDVLKRLEEQQHQVSVLHAGSVPLLKIDNIIYEAIPDANVYKFPVYGVRLRRYQM